MGDRTSSAEAEPVGRTYLVTGPQAVCGTASGETFTRELDPDREAFLVAVGHIRIVEPEYPQGSTDESATCAEEE